MTDRYEEIRKALADMDAAAEARNVLAWGDAHARLAAHVAPNTIRSLLAERDALARDADRYRWLRDECPRNWDVMYRDVEILIEDVQADDCEDLDELIDAAMREEGK